MRWLLPFALAGCSFDASGFAEGEGSGPGSTAAESSSSPGSSSSGTSATTTDAESSTVAPESSGTSSGETTTLGESSSDSTGGSGMLGPVCGGFFWDAQLDVDPTTLDVNGDGDADWTYSDGAFPVGTLVGGVWTVPPERSLQTAPAHAFATRTIVALRGRALQMGPGGLTMTLGLEGAGGTAFDITVRISLEPTGLQTVTVEGGSGVGPPQQIVQWPGNPPELLEVTLDLDPTVSTLGLAIGGNSAGMYPMPSYFDRAKPAATFGARMATAELDRVLVESCPP